VPAVVVVSKLELFSAAVTAHPIVVSIAKNSRSNKYVLAFSRAAVSLVIRVALYAVSNSARELPARHTN